MFLVFLLGCLTVCFLWWLSRRSSRKSVPDAVRDKRNSVPAKPVSDHRHAAPEPDIDAMRAGLQGVAYGMVRPGTDPDDKARFKQDMTEFAAADPLAKEIADRARLIVAESPGILQSGIYNHFPEYTQEQVRYALYFAHELGLIHRKKNGRSYQLFPPGHVIDA